MGPIPGLDGREHPDAGEGDTVCDFKVDDSVSLESERRIKRLAV